MKRLLSHLGVVALLCTGTSCSTPPQTTTKHTTSTPPAQEPVPEPEKIQESTFQNNVYTNITYGFSITVPKGTRLEDNQLSYMRLQNYTPHDDVSGLGAGEFYLEISPTQVNCSDMVVDAKVTQLDSKTVTYKGLGQTGGDAGGTRFALCVEKPDERIYIQVTEKDTRGTIANTIFSSYMPIATDVVQE